MVVTAFFGLNPDGLVVQLGSHLRERRTRIFVSGTFGQMTALFGTPTKPSRVIGHVTSTNFG